jgi:nucleotide-binding universal stress UspA family protein
MPSLSQRIKNIVRKRSDSVFKKGEKALKDFGLSAERKVRVGSTECEIISEANNGDYDLAVIGSQGIKGLEMFFFGALSYKLIEKIRKPVLVIKKGRKSVRRILVCTGGSEKASNAVDFAAKMIKALDVHVSLLHVAENDNPASPANGPEILRKAENVFGGARNVEKLLLHGHRSKKIIETAKLGDYDLVVLGETSMNPLKLLVSGSVVYEVLKGVNTPCLIVK